MKEEAILVPSKISKQVFQRFALFDVFCHRKQWKRPLIFAVIFTALSGLCLAFRNRQEGAALLGFTLLAVGFGLPLAYLLSYFLSLRQQIKRMNLREEQVFYTLRLDAAGVQAAAGDQKAFCPWEKLYMAYRVSDCVYLYVSRGQAYLLPDGPYSQDVWELLQTHLPREKLRS